ncbi:MATE family efflux transporter [Myxococcota bacterium]|jgi:multidrug resistance protein, MATE family|nr:MATE family efflux transporter [Myxococcota bacterium]
MGFNEQNATGITDQSGGLREMATLAAPLVLSQILITAMGVVDSVVVGRLGASELAAVGLAGIWVWALVQAFGTRRARPNLQAIRRLGRFRSGVWELIRI